jgi:hypothetical protein
VDFDQAQDIVAGLVQDLSDGETLRLLDWANAPRANELRESALVQKKLKGGLPGKPDELQAMTMAVGRKI